MHPFFQKEFPEIRKDKFEPETILSKAEFAKAAVARKPPLANADKVAAAELMRQICVQRWISSLTQEKKSSHSEKSAWPN